MGQVSCKATQIAQFLYFLNPKFQASSYLLRLHNLVCVGTGQRPDTGFLVTNLALISQAITDCTLVGQAPWHYYLFLWNVHLYCAGAAFVSSDNFTFSDLVSCDERKEK